MPSAKSMKAEAARKRALAGSKEETKYAADLRARAERADQRAKKLRKDSEDPMEAVFGVIGFLILVGCIVAYLAT